MCGGASTPNCLTCNISLICTQCQQGYTFSSGTTNCVKDKSDNDDESKTGISVFVIILIVLLGLVLIGVVIGNLFINLGVIVYFCKKQNSIDHRLLENANHR